MGGTIATKPENIPTDGHHHSVKTKRTNRPVSMLIVLGHPPNVPAIHPNRSCPVPKIFLPHELLMDRVGTVRTIHTIGCTMEPLLVYPNAPCDSIDPKRSATVDSVTRGRIVDP